jgi:hypothetical protein
VTGKNGKNGNERNKRTITFNKDFSIFFYEINQEKKQVQK